MSEVVDNVAILCCDIKDFTTISGSRKPDEVVKMLHSLFTKVDTLTDRHNVRASCSQ